MAEPKSSSEDNRSERKASRVDWLQLAFWACLMLAVAAASATAAWPNAGGPTGLILLISMAAGGMVFLLWIIRGAGRRMGLFPERGAMAEAMQPATPRYSWIDALDEAVLISDEGGAPIAANNAYSELTQMALLGQSDAMGPVSVDRIFSAAPGLAAPIFRLSKAAKAGESRREALPAMTLGAEALPVQYEASVAPLGKKRAIWRLRRIAGTQQITGAADIRALYVEDAPMGFFTSGADGTITYSNSWLRDLLGLPETAKNVRLDDIMRPEFVKMLRRDRKSGVPGRADIMIRSRDGVEVPVQTITTWNGKGADATGRTIVIANSHSLLEGEGRMLAASASRPPRPDGNPMFDDAPFGAARLEGSSLEGAIITDSNRALMGLAGGGAQPGTRFIDLFIAEDGEAVLREKLLDSIDKPVGLKLADEDQTHVNVFVTLDQRGQPEVAYVIDMSEQKELEMRLAQGEKMQAIGKLAGGVAHDFNNVLTGIILNNDHLMTLHPVGDPSFDHLKKIHEFSIRAKDLVQMLLAYARQQTFRREVFEPGEFLSEFSILLGQLLDERIEFDVVHGRDLPMIKADKNQLETAIINLATNARDALLMDGGRGGQLTIKTSKASEKDAHANGFRYVAENDYLLIEVTDTGHGIAPENLKNIFNPFFTTKPKGLGTGLGLSTVYGIIKQSEGYICALSEVGKGTTFQIYLPALREDELPESEPILSQDAQAIDQPVDVSGRGRILLVEDEDGVRSIAASQLRSRGYEVEEACDGEDALEILETNPGGFDLIVSDVVMPGMDGPTLIREAKDLLGPAKVLFMSGYAERDIAQQLDDDREVSFMPKPFTVKQLAERVKTELSSRSKEAA
ncbi:MAG: response regulator [Alphaproteobacteria bacterium]|nr:response regulator [Alphaproteobacteria bacterium]